VVTPPENGHFAVSLMILPFVLGFVLFEI
jgi:hypothetical protein